MEMSSVACTVFLLISLVVTDARTMELISTEESISSACNKCIIISRKAEATLNSARLFNEAHKLSSEACHVFPDTLKDKCLKKSEVYLHEARVLLVEFFDEGHLCNGTGLCTRSESPVDNYLGMNDEVKDERSCSTCRKAVRDISTRLKNPKMRSKIVEAFLDYCEEAEEGEDQCKQVIYQFAPIILHKIEKFKPSELCSKLGMCDEEMAMKIKVSV